MTIRQLIAHLLEKNDIDDEIIAAYWDKNFFIEWHELEKQNIDEVWEEFVKSGQETLDGHMDFIQTGYDLAEELETLIKEKGKN